jgi:NAD-dependent dihydropyrimidine dehydrogenase PreA subunit
MASDENGARVAVKYPERCTACGDCVSTCKFNALELTEKNAIFVS